MSFSDSKPLWRDGPRKLAAVFHEYLDAWFALFPQDGSKLGLKKFDRELGDHGPKTHRAYAELLRLTLARVEALPEFAFRGNAWLDRRVFLSMLRTGWHWHGSLQRWRDDPQVHCGAAIDAIFDLVIRNADDLPAIRPAIESRLAKLPAFLESGLDCLSRPVPLWTRLAGKTCKGAVLFLEELEKIFEPICDNPSRTARLFAEARAAFTAYARGSERKPAGSPGGFALGRENFEFLIREKLGLTWSLPEAEAMGENLVAQLTAQVKREAARFGKKPAHQIIADAAAEWCPASGNLLSEYQSATISIRSRFASAGLLTLPPREKLRVMSVPPFLRHQFPTAAYLAPGAFAKNQTGVFWVNDLAGEHSTPTARAAEVRQHFGLELTCAHEAYPGHHVQFVWQNRHPSKLRRLAGHAIFYEGWTLWCEKMCVDQGIYESPYARLMQLQDALWRAHRIVIDCGLHSGKLSFKAACRRLVEGAHFTPRRAEGDVNWYTSAPTVPMSYLLGRLELEKLHAYFTQTRHWTLKQFNDWVLSFGAIPWSWIWQSEAQP